MSDTRAGASVLGVLALGILIGFIADDDPPAPEPERTVKWIEKPSVPIVKTRIEYRTKTVTLPIPESCTRLASSTEEWLTLANDFNNWSSKYYDRIEDVDLEVLEDDAAMVDLMQDLADDKRPQVEALRQMLRLAERYEFIIHACEVDIADAQTVEESDAP